MALYSDVNTSNVDASHHLQREILIYLRQHGPSAYQELKPDGLEGNAYNYHLRLLKQAGLVVSVDGAYSLTGTGYLVSDAYSYSKRRLMLRPHVYTALLITSGDDMLVYRHNHGPLRDMIGLPSGKLHYGDSFAESIAKEASRRHLLAEYEARVLAPLNIRYMKGGQSVIHRPGILWHLQYRGPLAERETDNGRTYWVKRSDIAMMDVLPELSEGLHRLVEVSDAPIDLEWALPG